MKMFKEMFSILTTKGLLNPNNGNYYEKPLGYDEFTKDMMQCQPIVFEQQDAEALDLPDQDDEVLSAPFPFFSIEMSSGSITVPGPEEGQSIYIWAMFCGEITPGEFYTFALMTSDENPTGGRLYMLSSDDGWGLHIIKCMLKRLDTEATATQSVRASLKAKVNGEKIKGRIRRVVHVMPKAQAKKRKANGDKSFDFSHRFWVRGHWRRLSDGKMGKDRRGDYCVRGFTWVSESVKGEDHLPLIKKTRIVI